VKIKEPLRITSKENAKVQRLKKLGTSAKVRWKERSYLLEGPKFVLDALRRSDLVRGVYLSDGASETFLNSVSTQDFGEALDIYILSESLAAQVCDTKTSQGVFAEMGFKVLEMTLSDGSASNWLVLNAVQDPGNVGTLIRSAVSVGGFKVLLDTKSCDPYSPKAVRASAGLVGAIDVVRVGDLFDALSLITKWEGNLYFLEREAQVSIFEVPLMQPLGIVVGSEGGGIEDDLHRIAHRSVSIPMADVVESINVSVAGSLALFEFLRRNTKVELP